MKTITTFIVSLTLFIFAISVLFYSINTFKDVSTTFYNEDASYSYSFSFTFVLSSIISFIFAIILIINSIKFYSIHRKYYSAYMHDKRDREIKDKVENAKYNQLYEDLRDCETIELKEAVLNTFYSTKDIAKTSDYKRFVDMMTKPSKISKSDWADMDDIPKTDKPIRKIPTPHDLMGFELDDSTYSKKLKPTIDLLGFTDITFDKK